MTWVAWRVQRPLTVAVTSVLALIGIWLVLSGISYENTSAVWLHCTRSALVYGPGTCLASSDRLNVADTIAQWNKGGVYAIPMVVGLILGAALVGRELQGRTNRLAWTQGVARSRWVGTKLVIGAILVVAVLGALTGLDAWWTGAIGVTTVTYPTYFDITGIVPIAYGLFALALGAALGAVVRRPVWAFAAGVPLFALPRWWVRYVARPHLAPLVSVTTGVDGNYPPAANSGWVVGGGYVPSNRMSPAPGANWNTGSNRFFNCTIRHSDASCAHRLALHYVVQYQPASHYWMLQAGEAGIFVALAAGCAAVTFVAVRRWQS